MPALSRRLLKLAPVKALKGTPAGDFLARGVYAARSLAVAVDVKIPIAARVTQGKSSLKLQPGDLRALANKPSHVTFARPCQPTGWDNTLVWFGDKSPAERALLQTLKIRRVPGSLNLIDATSLPVSRPVVSQLDLIESTARPHRFTAGVTTGRNLFLVIDPRDPLPLLMAAQWRLTRTVVILTKPAQIDLERYLPDLTILVGRMAGVVVDHHSPLVVAVRSLLEAVEQLKPYAQSMTVSQQSYYFSLKDIKPGRVRFPALADEPDIVIESHAQHWPQFSTYRERVQQLIENSDNVWLHSTLVYPNEAWIKRGRHEDLLLRLLGQGARMSFIPSRRMP